MTVILSAMTVILSAAKDQHSIMAGASPATTIHEWAFRSCIVVATLAVAMRLAPAMLSAHRDRPFAEFTLSAAKGSG